MSQDHRSVWGQCVLEDLARLRRSHILPFSKPKAFDALDGHNNFNNHNGLIDFENIVIVCRRDSRLSGGAYKKPIKLISDPLTELAEKLGLPKEKTKISTDENKVAGDLAHEYLKATFFS